MNINIGPDAHFYRAALSWANVNGVSVKKGHKGRLKLAGPNVASQLCNALAVLYVQHGMSNPLVRVPLTLRDIDLMRERYVEDTEGWLAGTDNLGRTVRVEYFDDSKGDLV